MNFPHLISYLTSLGHAHPDIKHITNGDAEEILKSENFEITYPFYWVETPEPSIFGDTDNGVTVQWNAAIVVGHKSEVDNYDSDHRCRTETFQIVTTILAKIIEDYHNETICLKRLNVQGIGIDEIHQGSDNIVGYRLELPMSVMSKSDTSIMTEVPFAIPKLNVVGSEVIEQSTHDYIDYTREWKIYTSPDSTTSIDTAVQVDTTTNPDIYVELSYRRDAHEIVSSIYLKTRDGQTEITYAPYRNNPF